MIDILTECGIHRDIANIISYHLYIDYYKFYDEQIQNDLSVQSLIFLNVLEHLEVNEDIMRVYIMSI